MTEGLEKAHLYWTGSHLGLPCGHTNSNIEYIRKDVSDALIAAALKVGSDKLRKYNGLMGHEAIRKVVDEIMATTPDEASQALDALLKAEREKALREAGAVAQARWQTWQSESTQVSCDVSACDDISKAILALILEDKTYE